MSNVLIGIIGVILFIGLALAGAMFLGPQFQASTANSKAAAVTQGASQIASAVNLGNVQNGVTFDLTTGTPALLQTNSWLKSVPANPVTGGSAFAVVNMAALGAAPGTQTADYVMAGLGTGSQAVCDAIEKQSGGTTAQTYATAAAVITASATSAFRTVGCFKSTATLAGAPLVVANDYVVYAKI